MYGVELYAAVRLAVVEEGLSHREAGRRFGIDRRTVKKMLSYSAPPGYRRSCGCATAGCTWSRCSRARPRRWCSRRMSGPSASLAGSAGGASTTT